MIHRGRGAWWLLALAWMAGAGPVRAQGPETTQPAQPEHAVASRPVDRDAGQLAVTRHAIRLDDRSLRYTAAAGLLPIRNEDGKLQAEIFYVAYTLDGAPAASRPITFAFNGGPGAASIWLHLAALGPKRAILGDDGTALPARYRLIDNEHTWLPFTDLVFIDPPGTGFSRAGPGIDPKQYYNLKSDVQVVGEFIRLYVTQHERWLSPKFLAGESYGTTRAAALAGHLPRKAGMNLAGLVLISAALDFQAIMFNEGNDLPYIVFLTAYTATAWYHRKLPAELQAMPLEQVLLEAERWANSDYRLALAQGDALGAEESDRIVERYAWYTGLSESFIRAHSLRVGNYPFTREILRDRGRIVGIMDGRVTGLPGGREDFITDPSLFLTLGPLVATMNDYARGALEFRTDRSYEYLNMEIGSSWTWGSAAEGFPSVLPVLRQAMSANPRMKVLVAAGYYDLDTSYASQKYSIDHLLLDPSLRSNVRITCYHAGHQIYTRPSELQALTENAAGFYDEAATNAKTTMPAPQP